MAIEDLAVPPYFHNLYGAQLLASIINTFLYGTALILCLQYFRKYGKTDSILLVGTVALLIVCATIETAASAHQSYDCFITKFGQSDLFNIIVPSVLIEFMFCYITAFVAQLFFASRIWRVGQHWGLKFQLLAVPVVILAFLQLGAGAGQVDLMRKAKLYTSLDEVTPKLLKLTTMQGASAAACDIWITAALVWGFHSHRSGLRRTNSLIDRLIIYAINRGAVTSICAVLHIVFYSHLSGTFYFLIPLQATTHFYVISAVTVLTSREGLRKDMDNSFHISELTGMGMGIGTTGTSSQNGTTSTPNEKPDIKDASAHV